MSYVINVTDDDFEAEVKERSYQVPVIVDFWAEWCGPCRTLGPILEKLAEENSGRFILAKADTEKTQKTAAEFRVQSIPAVYAVQDGQVIDGFIGGMPEPQIREWLERVLPSEIDLMVAEAKKREVVDPDGAIELLQTAIEKDARNRAPKIELARILFDQKQTDAARDLIAELEKSGFLEPEAERVKAALDLLQDDANSGDVDQCRANLEKDPDNLELQMQLAETLAANSTFEEALSVFLSIVQKDRGDLREKARQKMVDIFRVLPTDSELTNNFRRKLSMALY